MEKRRFADILGLKISPHYASEYIESRWRSKWWWLVEKGGQLEEVCKTWAFSAVTVMYVVFWDIRNQYVSHRWHITSPLLSPVGYCYVSFEAFTAVTMRNGVFWNIKNQFVPHRRYIPVTEPSWLMLCKFWGFHGGNYEEWRHLEYKEPVRTSQEIYPRCTAQLVNAM
jgi:hypothetical protein